MKPGAQAHQLIYRMLRGLKKRSHEQVSDFPSTPNWIIEMTQAKALVYVVNKSTW